MKSGILRGFSFLLSLVFAAAAFTGCGSQQSGSSVQSSEPTAAVASDAGTPGSLEPVKLTWWTFKNSDQKFMQSYIDKYNQTNKDNVTINYVVQTSNNFRQALQLAFQSNQAPDLFTGQDLASIYVPKGQVEALDPYITPDIKERWGDYYYSEGDNGVDGKVYSLPSQGITYRLMYNKDLFQKAGIAAPPTSMAELVEDAKEIAQAGKAEQVYGFAINMKNTQTSMERSVNIIGMKSGFRYYDYKTGKYDFTPYKPILEAFHQIVADGSMFPGYESLDIDPLRMQFINGKIGMYFGGAWEPSAYVGLNPDAKINYGAAPVPTVDGTVKGPSFISGLRWLFMSSTTQYKDQVWNVMNYFYSDEVQAEYARQGLGVVIIPSVVKMKQPSELKGIADFMPTKEDAIYPKVPNESALAIQGQTFDAVFAAIIGGQMTFDKEVDGLNQKYNDALTAAIKENAVKDYKLPDFDPASLIGK